MNTIDNELRPVTDDDALLVADLETACTPEEPQDGAMVAFRWSHDPESKYAMRLVAEQDRAVWWFVEASHEEWNRDDARFGRVHTAIHPARWTEEMFRQGIATGESWLDRETAGTAVVYVRADFANALAVLGALGYREVRQGRFWELDLVARRGQLLEGAERCRAEMREQGIELHTLDRERDPDVLNKLYKLDLEATKDIPTTAPIVEPGFDEWIQMYFANPGVRKDRFWIARAGDEIVGMSVIAFPPGREVPSTEFTATSRPYRGKGVARALKYETVAQASAAGVSRVRTDNDFQNAPILKLNAEMGYQPMTPYLELHRDLTPGASSPG